jgi:hypothetical protein
VPPHYPTTYLDSTNVNVNVNVNVNINMAPTDNLGNVNREFWK